ncbi:hypothetical protein ACFS2C_04265 [Prauserella oleivorans]|uniref:Lipoprotein n=1 Tax=Prauserella oleivorans TaxID=1478153 RepID=A0ABW5W483_9PSEU
MRRLSLLLLLLIAGCGSSLGPGVAGQSCSAIGAPRGIGVDIARQASGRVAQSATIEACWDGRCRTYAVRLVPATTAGDPTCAGDICSARVRETGGRHGFAAIPDLPRQPVRVTLVVAGATGPDLVRRTVVVTPTPAYPNGPDCGAGGPVASLAVDATGAVGFRT